MASLISSFLVWNLKTNRPITLEPTTIWGFQPALYHPYPSYLTLLSLFVAYFTSSFWTLKFNVPHRIWIHKLQTNHQVFITLCYLQTFSIRFDVVFIVPPYWGQKMKNSEYRAGVRLYELLGRYVEKSHSIVFWNKYWIVCWKSHSIVCRKKS